MIGRPGKCRKPMQPRSILDNHHLLRCDHKLICTSPPSYKLSYQLSAIIPHRNGVISQALAKGVHRNCGQIVQCHHCFEQLFACIPHCGLAWPTECSILLSSFVSSPPPVEIVVVSLHLPVCTLSVAAVPYSFRT